MIVNFSSEMIQALADQLGQEEGEEVLEGSEHQEKLRDLLK